MTGSMTLSGWVNATRSPWTMRRWCPSVPAARSDSSSTRPKTGVRAPSGSSSPQLGRTCSATGPPRCRPTAGTTSPASTMRRPEPYVYLNGQLDNGTLSGHGHAPSRTRPPNVNIGRRRASGGLPSPARIDDVRIYGRALTAAEIQADMAAPLASGRSHRSQSPGRVDLEQPAAGAAGERHRGREAHATDDVGVAGVQFFVDGVATGSKTRPSPMR